MGTSDWTDIQKAASALGKKGGKSTSEKKRLASRANGFQGGRNNVKWNVWWVFEGQASLIPLKTGKGVLVKARNAEEALRKVGKNGL